MEKSAARTEIVAKRNSLSKEQVDSLSGEICSRAIDVIKKLPVDSVAIYISIHNEVRAELLSGQLATLGKKVFVPVVEGEQMKFALLEAGGELVKGEFGVLKPRKNIFAKPGEIKIFVVPGIAFDAEGNRLGWGKGYYDKFLAGERGVKIGFAYDFQIVDLISKAPHDIKMDAVVTQTRVIEGR